MKKERSASLPQFFQLVGINHNKYLTASIQGAPILNFFGQTPSTKTALRRTRLRTRVRANQNSVMHMKFHLKFE